MGSSCAACGFESLPDLKFCGRCGQPLSLTCAHCRAAIPPGFRFCGECGTLVASAAGSSDSSSPPLARSYTPKHLADKILASKSAIEGERKQVTVLFADVKSSLELAERVDPEEWHRILDRFFAILTDGVHRFEGTVNQYTGDGIMALFGAPIAHEDHAQRACYAALQLRDALRAFAQELRRERGLDFTTRIGLNSGEVIVGRIGDDLRMDYTAQGATVGLAQRMEQLAEAGRIYISADTARLARGYFELDDLGAFRVKGMSDPVPVFELRGTGAHRTRFERARARGLTRFVGRDADMATLDAAFAQASAGGGQVVGVVAPPGTGKSRLCFEFLEAHRARGVTVVEGHALAHGKSIPFLPMTELFRAWFGIGATDDARSVREKIAGRLLLLDDSFREALPVVFEAFGAADPHRPVKPTSAEERQRQLFGVLRRVAQGDGEPLVIFLDDLHWFDAMSDQLLVQMVDAVERSRTLLLVAFRPEYRADWMRRSWYRQIALAPLGPDALQQMLDDLLGRDASVTSLARRIHERTHGNPFFAEEVVQGLVESGQLAGARGAYRLVEAVDRLDIPASVTVLLASRIDRLGDREKHVLQAAAVLGKTFAEPLLRTLVELSQDALRAALDTLRRGEFVYDQSLYPVAEYTFKHPLTQEVALGSQLGERRRALHERAAHALEAALSAQLDENAALIAHHWEAAGDAREAARWQRRAAQWLQVRDTNQALHHWRRVHELVSGSDDEEAQRFALDACRGIVLMGWRHGLPDLVEISEQGRALALRFGDRSALVVITVMVLCQKGLGGDDFRGTYDGLLEVEKLIDGSVDTGTHVIFRHHLAYFAYCCGRLVEALHRFGMVRTLAAGDVLAGIELGFSPEIFAEGMSAVTLAYLGRFDEADAAASSTIRRAREASIKENLLWALGVPIQVDWLYGDDRAASAAIAETVRVAESLENPFDQADLQFSLVLTHLLGGRFADAVAASDRWLALVRGADVGRESESLQLAYRAIALTALGDGAGAVSSAREAVSIASAEPSYHYGIEACCALANALVAHEGTAARREVEQTIAQAFEWLAESGAEGLRPRVLEALAALAGALGDDAAKARDLAKALRLYRAMGAHGHAARLAGVVSV